MMNLRVDIRWIALALAIAVGAKPAKALVSLEDGLDHVFVTGTFGIAYDSNVFTNKSSGGDTTMSYGVTVEFNRQAGWIGVNASVAWNGTNFAHDTTQNFLNPAYNAEFTKQTGRTTGSLTLGAQRQSRADVAVNLRDTSWSYNAGLNFKYPVIERYSLSGSLGYGLIDYSNRVLFTNLATYSANLDLYYVLSDARDLFGGYRYRYSQSTANTYDVDHALTAGVSGKVIGPLNGSLRLGYQIRQDHAAKVTTYPAFTAAGSLTWDINRKLSSTLSLSKDFSTTATDISLDQNTADLGVQYAMNSKFSITGGVSAGLTDYLGRLGVVNATIVGSPQRRDEYFSWNAGVNYTLSQHLKASLAYSFYENWSNLDYAVFSRNNWTLTISSRW